MAVTMPAPVWSPGHVLTGRAALSVFDDPFALETRWRAFEAGAVGHVFQCYDWMAAWCAHVAPVHGIEPRIVIGTDGDGRDLFLLPMGLRRVCGVTTLCWLGGTQADYQGGLFDPDYLAGPGSDPDTGDALLSRIAEAVGGIDAVHLIRQPVTLGGHRNPFLCEGGYRNASAAHSTVLGDDWQTYYAAKRASGWRRTDRRKLKELEAYGEVAFIEGDDPTACRAILDTLVDQKRRGLAQMGVGDMFAPEGVLAFYRDLAARHLPRGPAHLCALTCGGDIVATNFSLVRGDTYYYVVHAYELDRFREQSPGRALMYEIMRWCIARGLTRLDFTIGDEGYKAMWCEETIELQDAVSAGTLAGTAVAASARLQEAVKRTVKNDPRLWALARRVRSGLGGRPES